MAVTEKTISQIKDEILTAAENEAAGDPNVDLPTTTSATGLYNLIAFAVATVFFLHQKIFNTHQEELQNLVDQNYIGTPDWYVSQLLKFQKGDTLVIKNESEIGYAVEDEDKQIIDRASYLEQSSSILLKAAKEDSSGNLTQLTSDEKTQVEAYIEAISPAGVNWSFLSEPADKLRASIDIYYNPLINLNTIKTDVKQAIKDYLGAIPFNGKVKKLHLVDAIQEVEGIEDVLVQQLTGVEDNGTTTTFTREYQTRAGYIIPDDTAGNTLDDLLNFIAA